MPDCIVPCMSDAPKGYPALRKGRWSNPGAEYFITICLARPSIALEKAELQQSAFNQLKRLEADQIFFLRCAVLMPDHLHLLITLGDAANLSSAVRLFKGRLTPVLRRYQSAWQPAFYDHRMVSREDRLPVFLYIFLNPYRKGLVPPGQIWPGYYCSPEDWAWFRTLTHEGRPEPDWVK